MEDNEPLLTQPGSPSSTGTQSARSCNSANREVVPHSMDNMEMHMDTQSNSQTLPPIPPLFVPNENKSRSKIHTSLPFPPSKYEQILGNSAESSSSSDDEESSLSSSDSSTSDILVKRDKNIARHKWFMSQLDIKYRTAPMNNGKISGNVVEDVEQDEVDIGEDTVPKGMLLKRRHGCVPLARTDSPSIRQNGIKRLRHLYPFREHQINTLSCLIDASIGQIREGQRSGSTFVPAPIFVSGPTGTGKTSVVRDVINTVKEGKSSWLEYAYVNCSILEPSSIDRLVSFAISQLVPCKRNTSNRKQRKRKRKRRVQRLPALRSGSLTGAVSSDPQPLDANHSNGSFFDRTRIGHETASRGAPDSWPTDSATSTELKLQNPSSLPGEGYRRSQPERKVSLSCQQTRIRQPDLFSPQRDAKSQLIDTVWTLHSVVSSFGRTLQPAFGRNGKKSAVLVLDHADRLLSLSMKKIPNDQTNYLSELLVLPKAMELNLTIIVISNNCCLDSSRLNSLVAVRKSVSTLSNGVQPFVIQFPAYKGIEVFTKILRVPRLVNLIVGDQLFLRTPLKPLPWSIKKHFRTRVIESFIITLAQSVSNSTRDLRELLRVGRALFPMYIRPLHPSNIVTTVELVGNQLTHGAMGGIESRLLAFLDKKFLREAGRFVGRSLFSLSIDSPISKPAQAVPVHPQAWLDEGQPYTRICLLLAAYICQNNKSDKDKHVFSIQGKGSKRTRRSPVESTLDDVAFISRMGDRQELNVVRLRPFPLERMLSIYVTLYRLNTPPSGMGITQNSQQMLQSLGSSYLYENLAQLRDLGYLHEVQTVGQLKAEQVPMSAARYVCSLTKAEAVSISLAADIPLNNYLL